MPFTANDKQDKYNLMTRSSEVRHSANRHG